MIQNGKTLSMHSDSVYKGDSTHNGSLLKLHENAFTIGYSALLSADGTQAGVVKFGDAVFLDANQKDNKAYTGSPTTLGAVPTFGGIVVREPAIASGYPVLNDEVAQFQKGLLCKEGFIIYKKGRVCTGTGGMVEDVALFGKVFTNHCVFVNKTNGKIYFSPKSTVYYQSGDIMVGRVVGNNPDDTSVTVKVSPTLQADTADIAGATPTITVGTETANTIPLTVSNTTGDVIVISYKKGTDDYTVFGEVKPVLNSAGTAYEATATITGLIAGTAYTIKADSFTACGFKSDTETGTTAGA